MINNSEPNTQENIQLTIFDVFPELDLDYGIETIEPETIANWGDDEADESIQNNIDNQLAEDETNPFNAQDEYDELMESIEYQLSRANRNRLSPNPPIRLFTFDQTAGLIN